MDLDKIAGLLKETDSTAPFSKRQKKRPHIYHRKYTIKPWGWATP